MSTDESAATRLQEELAFRAGLQRTYVSSLERGERNVALINIERLAIALDLRIHELVEDV